MVINGYVSFVGGITIGLWNWFGGVALQQRFLRQFIDSWMSLCILGTCCKLARLANQIIDINQEKPLARERQWDGSSGLFGNNDLGVGVNYGFQSSEQGVWQQKWCGPRHYGYLQLQTLYWKYHGMFTFQSTMVAKAKIYITSTSLDNFADLWMQTVEEISNLITTYHSFRGSQVQHPKTTMGCKAGHGFRAIAHGKALGGLDGLNSIMQSGSDLGDVINPGRPWFISNRLIPFTEGLG